MKFVRTFCFSVPIAILASFDWPSILRCQRSKRKKNPSGITGSSIPMLTGGLGSIYHTRLDLLPVTLMHSEVRVHHGPLHTSALRRAAIPTCLCSRLVVRRNRKAIELQMGLNWTWMFEDLIDSQDHLQFHTSETPINYVTKNMSNFLYGYFDKFV